MQPAARAVIREPAAERSSPIHVIPAKAGICPGLLLKR
jgi:hypothetical protein